MILEPDVLSEAVLHHMESVGGQKLSFMYTIFRCDLLALVGFATIPCSSELLLPISPTKVWNFCPGKNEDCYGYALIKHLYI